MTEHLRRYGMVIVGQSMEGTSYVEVKNPSNRTIIDLMPDCTERDLNAAVGQVDRGPPLMWFSLDQQSPRDPAECAVRRLLRNPVLVRNSPKTGSQHTPMSR